MDFGNIMTSVLLKMKLTPLPRCVGESSFQCGQEPFVIVTDDIADAMETSILEAP